jgi:hypothetical protein
MTETFRSVPATFVEDPRPADWIAGELFRPGAGTPASLIPHAYETVVRILHPAIRTSRSSAAHRPCTWSEIATSTGSELTWRSTFEEVVHPSERFGPRWGGERPPEGNLGAVETAALAAILAEQTATEGRCWFCIWTGYSFVKAASVPIETRVRVRPRNGEFPSAYRDYLLYRGRTHLAAAFWFGEDHQSPNIWWPDDRSWVVHSEIDESSTYVGCTRLCGEEILASRHLEALIVSLDE